ncbi:MAG: hypothetical protein K2I89_09180, partial [Muribaculaceae bacterium]|nr:hypothetical protein [Muribaculaceae bacterium]
TYTESTESGDIKIIFQKCMTNKLFTFYQVYLNDKIVNSAQTSDNIGPFMAGGAWMGGNHNTPQGGPKPSANTVNINVTVDGKTLKAGDGANNISVLKIDVENEIFYTDDKKFADEFITYAVSGNSIEVWCAHRFQYPNPMSVSRYYGPQSMFPATELLLPGFGDNKWISLSGKKEIDVMKSDFPDFSTYIEKNANGYQAVLKYNEGIGDASCVKGSDGRVYLFRNYGGATGKSYHVMMWNHSVKSGDNTNWHALYTWFDGPVEDTFREGAADPKFVYESYINGEPTEITVLANGKSTEPVAGIEEIVADNETIFAYAGDNKIVITSDAPNAVCVDLTGKVIARGAGSFPCTKGIYIVNDMRGRSVKLIVK